MGAIVVTMYLGVPALIGLGNAVGYIDQPLTLSFLTFTSVFMLVLLAPMALIFLFVDVDSLASVK